MTLACTVLDRLMMYSCMMCGVVCGCVVACGVVLCRVVSCGVV